MTPEKHTQELAELLKETVTITEIPGTSEVKTNVKRELTRLELGHCFSLGLSKIKRSGEGVSLTFDRAKASLNEIYSTDDRL